MSRKLLTPLLALLTVLASSFAFAAAPQPVNPVPAGFYSGRWYEIARIPNRMQRDCQGPTSDFQNFRAGVFRVIQVCHRGSVDGPVQTYRATGRILPSSNNAKMQLSFFGGMVRQEYWILDRADDGAWAIMATPGGNYVWLLSRRPILDAGVRARIVSRIGQLGYNTARLQYPAQAR